MIESSKLVHTVISEIFFGPFVFLFFDWWLCNLSVRDCSVKWLLMPELKNLQLIIILTYFSEYCLKTFCLLVPVVVN